ncbi:MAG: amidohydrolase family protein [Pseudomonadota bacterium]
MLRNTLSCAMLILSAAVAPVIAEHPYSLVINNGRVIDPETSLDAVRHIGISGDRIETISEQALAGDSVIDASGLVVSPGFIDLHTHSPTPLGQHYQAFDGVTTAMELEAGFSPVKNYAAQISATPVINYGASAGYVSLRMKEKNGVQMALGADNAKPIGFKGWKTALMVWLTDRETAMAPSFVELADEAELKNLRQELLLELDAGALGIGLPLDYFSTAIQDAEMRMLFGVAAERSAPIFVHVRRGIDGDPSGLREVIGLAKDFGTSVHICHITHNAISNLDLFLSEIAAARESGVDITTEVLPYNAGSAMISSAVFGRDWQTIFNITYSDVEWAATGERFNKQMWEEYRREHPGGQVIHHYLQEKWTQQAVKAPGVIIVSDLLPMETKDKHVAPHNGAFTKILGRYVREQGLLDLPVALTKMTLLPAQRLQNYVPAFKRKGRLQESMDADITIFNPSTVRDNATYKDPYKEATGINYVIVNGVAIISDGQLVEGRFPGRRQLKTNQ